MAASSSALAAGAIGMLEVDATQPSDSHEDHDSPGSIDDTLPMETVVEDLNNESAPDHAEGILAEEMGDEFLPDSPTLVDDPDETVRIDNDIEEDIDDDIDATIDLDPNPSQDEVDLQEVADVELSGPGFTNQGDDPNELEAFDPDAPTLDVGDLFADKPAVDPLSETVDLEPDGPNPMIQPLRNEDSFSPDEDSIQVKPDPLTGELKFETDADDLDETIDFTDGDDEPDDLLSDFGNGLDDKS